MFLSPNYVDCFLGMAQAESNALLTELVDHLTSPATTHAHTWKTNDAVLWDNRRMMHAAMGNDPKERRRGLRTTLAGPMRIGRYFDSNAVAPALSVEM